MYSNIAEGEHKKSIKTAKKMKAYGDSVEKIKEITGLSQKRSNLSKPIPSFPPLHVRIYSSSLSWGKKQTTWMLSLQPLSMEG